MSPRLPPPTTAPIIRTARLEILAHQAGQQTEPLPLAALLHQIVDAADADTSVLRTGLAAAIGMIEAQAAQLKDAERARLALARGGFAPGQWVEEKDLDGEGGETTVSRWQPHTLEQQAEAAVARLTRLLDDGLSSCGGRLRA